MITAVSSVQTKKTFELAIAVLCFIQYFICRLLLFTDGLFEEFNSHNEEYGKARILSILKDNLTGDIGTVIHFIQKDLDKFLNSAPIQDDITVIGVQG